MPLLEIRDLSVSFTTRRGPFRAVEGCDIVVDENEELAIVGESGSGKSVAMLAVMGLLPWTATVTAGKMNFAGTDLRSLSPLDKDAVLAVTRHCNRVLIVHEDSRTGGIGESLAAIIQEEAFEALDAPVRVLGALDTPVPYSPPLEELFLVSENEIDRAARLLIQY